MKAFEMNKLMLVALVACLPIACGSTSPTGPVVDGLDAEMTASALRAEPGLPPTAPQAPSTEADTVPSTEADAVPQTGTPTADPVPSPDPNSGSRPNPNTGSRPLPTPSADPNTVPAPSAGPDTGAVPAPPVSQIPPPPSSDDTGSRQCLAAQAEIMILRGSLPQPTFANSVRLEMVMLGSDGKQITDRSCRGLAWSFVEGRFAAGATITVSDDARFATVTGTPGPYQIRAITSNGLMATVGITLQ
jgi:hypothetical protein